MKVNVKRSGAAAPGKEETLPAAQQRVAARGFTLLEILLVVALIGLMATVLVVGGARLLARDPVTPEEIFWEAMSQARQYALVHQTEVHLAFDREKRSFVARTALGAETFPVPPGPEFQLDFLSAQRSGPTVLIGGMLVETRPLTAITFYDDGTCTPFRLQLRVGSGEARIIPIDPWTCAPMLKAEGSSS